MSSSEDGGGEDEDSEDDAVPEPPSKLTKRILRGSLEYRIACRLMLEGPIDVNSLADWPMTVVCRQLFGPKSSHGFARRCRIFAILESRLINHTDFSGRLGPEVGLRMMEIALAKHGLPATWLLEFRSCEKTDN